MYSLKDATAAVERAPDPGLGQGDYVDGPRKCFAGGAGLLSTATDYARFLQMLVNGGELDGVRILGPKTVELMTSNAVGTLFNEGKSGFGLGFEIVDTVGAVGRAWIARHLLVGRRIPHELLGRPEGEDRRGADDAAAARQRQRPAQQVPLHGVSGCRRPS